MGFNVIPTDKFKKEAKRLIRKFPSLKEELRELSTTLSEHPETGKPLGKDTYKIRIAIKSKGKGKSGGARVITYLVTENKEIYLLLIYDKSEFDNVDDKLLQQIIDGLDTV
ncbi:MAG: type II toxin-antitoxin system RelE/ParE family toxin [Chitinophagaceae bacterium]